MQATLLNKNSNNLIFFCMIKALLDPESSSPSGSPATLIWYFDYSWYKWNLLPSVLAEALGLQLNSIVHINP